MTHPFCWPYVRRGTERTIEILSKWLVGRGHEVTLLSSRPGKGVIERDGNRTRILRPQHWSPWLAKLNIEPQHTFFFTSMQAVRNMDADVFHSYFFTDALAVGLARGRRSYRTVMQLNGIAIPGVSTHRVPPEAWMLRKAIDSVDEFVVCSRFIQQLAQRYYGRKPKVVTPPVEFESWPFGSGPEDGNPVLLAVGDFEVRRKGVRVLVRAFDLLKKQVPQAILRVSGNITQETIDQATYGLDASVRADVHFLGLGQPGDLPRLYQTASITVLPSMWEPSAGCLLESLASGTPFVATNHGGMPEYITPETGVLFDPQTEGEETSNAAGLCQAMLQGLELASRTAVRENCRAHAANFAACVQGPEFERVYAGG
jgi:glycosyltransferase involved in cell wall biosynthesis